MVSLFLLLAAVIVILPQVISLEDVKHKIEASINEQINGQCKIVSLKLSTFPWLGFKVTNFTILNGDQFKNSELFKVLNLGVHVQLRPLLQGKIIGEIIIDKPMILLETLPNGRKSIDALMKPSVAAKTSAPGTKPPGDFQNKIERMLEEAVIEKLAIDQGELHLVTLDEAFKRKGGFDLRHFDLEIEHLAFNGEVPLKLGVALFDLNKPDVEFEGLLETHLNPKDLKGSDQTIKIKSASLRINQIETTLSGVVEQRKGSDLFVDIATKTAGISLAKLENNIPLLKGKIPQGLEGDLTVETKNKGPLGALASDISLNSKIIGMPIAGQKEKLVISNTVSHLHFLKQILTIKDFKTNVFDRDLLVDGSVSLEKSDPVVDLKIKTDELNLHDALNAFSDKKDIFYGLGSIDMTVNGTMDSGKAPKENSPLVPAWINAQGTMKIKDGKVATLNLMGDTVKTLMQLSPIPDDIRTQLEKHEWKMLTTQFSTKAGSLNFKTLVMDYGTSKITMTGDILADTTLKLAGDISLPPTTVGSLGGSFNVLAKPDGSMDLPVKVSGKLSRPITYIDAVSLVKRATKATINNVVAPQVKGILKDFSNILQTPKETQAQ